MKSVKTAMAKKVFGITVCEAQAAGICIKCREPAIPKCYSEAGKREYIISGLCEKCFDGIMGTG